MNENLRDRILRKLDALSDERGYQILDYVEFLESKYAEKQAPGQSAFTRFAEAVEDRMRAGRVSAQTISETMGLLNRAVGILNGVAAAGRSMAEDLIGTTGGTTGGAAGASGSPAGPGGPGQGAAGEQGTPPASAGGGTGGTTPPAQTPPPSAQGDGAEASTTQGGPRP